MIQAIYKMLEKHNFNEKPSLELDLDNLRQDEGYYFSTTLEPMLRLSYDASMGVVVEIVFGYNNNVIYHLEKIQTLLEKFKSFILLPFCKEYSLRAEVRLERTFAICISLVPLDDKPYIDAMRVGINVLFLLMTLY